MLVKLIVKDLAIIENLDIRLEGGLNILSGETGSGKSVLLKSLSILMGAKSSADIVRSGANQAVVEGLFDLSQRQDVVEKLKSLGIDHEDELIVRRIVSADKSRVYLNGSLCNLNTLRSVVSPMIGIDDGGRSLIEVTGQHDNHNLKSKSYHLETLDDHCNIWPLKSKYIEKYKSLKSVKAEITKLLDSSKDQSRLEFLKYQCAEIDSLNLSEDRDDNLYEELKRISQRSSLKKFSEDACYELSEREGSVTEILSKVAASYPSSSETDTKSKEIIRSILSAKSLIEDASYELRRIAGTQESNESQMEEIEERLSRVKKLTRKHGGTVKSVLEHLSVMKDEINLLENIEIRISELRIVESKLTKEVIELAKNLTDSRKLGIESLVKRVNRELSDLNMKGVVFDVAIAPVNINEDGADEVEFQLNNSKNGDPKPISKFASGGELSRILLALKRSSADAEAPRTLVFDEVDSGVSGETAEKIGRKLKQAAIKNQVICVTHLPQVAVFADYHCYISKQQSNKGHSMSVEVLDQTGRLKEISRLLSGEKISKSSMDHAAQLIKEAKSA